MCRAVASRPRRLAEAEPKTRAPAPSSSNACSESRIVSSLSKNVVPSARAVIAVEEAEALRIRKPAGGVAARAIARRRRRAPLRQISGSDFAQRRELTHGPCAASGADNRLTTLRRLKLREHDEHRSTECRVAEGRNRALGPRRRPMVRDAGAAQDEDAISRYRDWPPARRETSAATA
jgi:hypothetical protein